MNFVVPNFWYKFLDFTPVSSPHIPGNYFASEVPQVDKPSAVMRFSGKRFMLLHRYIIKVTPEGAKLSEISSDDAPNHTSVKLTIITSFYRRSVDAGYRRLIASLAEEGSFDEYIAALVMSLVNTGNVFRQNR